MGGGLARRCEPVRVTRAHNVDDVGGLAGDAEPGERCPEGAGRQKAGATRVDQSERLEWGKATLGEGEARAHRLGTLLEQVHLAAQREHLRRAHERKRSAPT